MIKLEKLCVEYVMAQAEEVFKVALRQNDLPHDEIAIASNEERSAHYCQQTTCMLVRILEPMVVRFEVTYLQKENANAEYPTKS